MSQLRHLKDMFAFFTDLKGEWAILHRSAQVENRDLMLAQLQAAGRSHVAVFISGLVTMWPALAILWFGGATPHFAQYAAPLYTIAAIVGYRVHVRVKEYAAEGDAGFSSSKYRSKRLAGFCCFAMSGAIIRTSVLLSQAR
jgi:hypothetical protein